MYSVFTVHLMTFDIHQNTCTFTHHCYHVTISITYNIMHVFVYYHKLITMCEYYLNYCLYTNYTWYCRYLFTEF